MKNIMKQFNGRCLMTALLLFSFLTACSDDKEAAEPVVTIPETILNAGLSFSGSGETKSLSILTNVSLTVSSDETWCKVEHKNTTNKGTARYEVTMEPNPTTGERTANITITGGDITKTVKAIQAVKVETDEPDEPDTPEETLPDVGMNSDAKVLAAKIKIGWNLGNTMEVPFSAGGETGWGNAVTTKKLIDAVKAAGFNAVRIPCAWDGYIEDQTTYKLKESWLNRVKEVVNYCLLNDMYAIVNTHWDGGWLENNPTYAKQEEVNKKLAAIWTQIANTFSTYDEHLLFAGTNEVHVTDVYTKPTAENNAVQQSFNQTFVDAVRATGGRNAQRNLIVQTYNTNIAWGVESLKMPTDATANRLMVEVHYYDPYNFALNEGSGAVLYWGEPYKQYGAVDNYGQEDDLDAAFKSAKTAFGDKGYPVILGEYGALRRSTLTGDEQIHHLASRAYYLETVTAVAKKYGIVPFYWDNGYNGDKTMALFNRANGAVYDQQALDALMKGAGNE